MKKTLLFLADQTETNLHHLRHCADERKLPHRTLSLSFHNGRPLSALIANQGSRYTLTDNNHEHFDLGDLGGVWSRGISAPPTPIPGTPDNLAYHEWLAVSYHWREALSHCFWMNEMEDIRRASSRLGQMAVARKHGFAVPETLVTNDPVLAREFLRRKGKIVIKHISAGSPSSMGDRSLFTVAIDQHDEEVLEQVRYCPTLLQECVEKAVELRVTVVGDRVFTAALETNKWANTQIDCRRWVETDLTYFRARLTDDINRRIVQLVRELRLEYGAVDFIAQPNGELVFLEVNPSGQWGYVEMASGHAITDAIISRLQEKLCA